MNSLSPALRATTKRSPRKLKVKSQREQEIGKKILSFVFYLLPFAFVNPASGAERIYVTYGPLEFSLPVSALEVYARKGKINEDLAAYAGYVDKKQLEQLRQVLLAKVDVTPLAVSQFLYSPLGQILLQRVGQIIQTQSGQPGFYAIRSALILAAAEPEGLTLLGVLEKFPTQGIRINSSRGFEVIGDLTNTIRQTQVAIASVNQEASTEALTPLSISLSKLPDLRQPGQVKFSKQTLIINNPNRARTFPVDIYLPTPPQAGLIPVIVISHGLGGDRKTFAYLAEHLASYGFAVAVPEHPGSNSGQLQALINGLAKDVSPPRELIDRPLDVKDVLDELERSFSGQVNMQQVGVIGQSFGGYTALALAGAKINFEQLQKGCRFNDSLNLSILLQCRALVLPPIDYQLQDERVKAAIAINPIDSTIFGQTEVAKIKIPLMLVASSADAIAPALPEQIQPFTWLTTPHKYLALFQEGTHFSTLAESAQSNGVVQLPTSVLGPDPVIAFQYVKALSLAFFETYVAGNAQYHPYLSATYANSISQSPMPLSLIQSLKPSQLNGKTTAETPKR